MICLASLLYGKQRDSRPNTPDCLLRTHALRFLLVFPLEEVQLGGEDITLSLKITIR